ncbi:MAG: rRNA maturation RNase YbeY, partial [Oscillospiraceae bacterium]
MITIKVHITNRQSDLKIPTGIRLLIRKCCNAVLKIEEFPHDCDVSVSFTNNDQIRELNQKYRQKNSETDVLSFPLNEDGSYELDAETGFCQIGDIIISVPKAMEQAEKYGHTLMREMGF